MKRRMAALAVLLFLLLSPLWVLGQEVRAGRVEPEPVNCTGIWDSSYMLSTIVVEIEHEGEMFKGVAKVYGPFGVDVYHLAGFINNNGTILGFHGSGHRFDGQIVSKNKAEGVLTTAKRKFKIDLTAVRRTGDQM